MQETEGFVKVLGYRLFYRAFGNPGDPSVLGLHGGPGATHDYLLPLTDLTQDGFRVVLFDLLGCGRSEVPEDHSLFTLDHNVAEVEGMRSELGLGRVHLIGSSYGGLLALAYAIRWPAHLRSLVTVGGLANVAFAAAEMARLKEFLPAETQARMRKYEATGSFQDPEYLQAVGEFYRNFLCRLEPWPPELQHSLEMTERRPVYAQMNGPNEFTITGTIRDVDLTAELGRIRTPTLVLGGHFDEVTPKVAMQIESGIPGSRRVEFANSSHVPFWEERALFRSTVAAFLRAHV
ncbi:MAG: proline iminopeptidase-family hydrolase [Thermoplasmata archaeon]|nr:proline iminopeptidase-family hydrolase [Thermoplasmata archaeon]